MKSGPEFSRELIEKAENDIAAALIGIQHGAPLDAVRFHLQQAVQKLLKAVLNFRNIRYPLTHDIDELWELAIPCFPELSSFLDRFEGFAPYAVELRYSTTFRPSQEEVAAGFQAVQEFQSLMYALLPPEIRPRRS
jgi:HEPN domain-containing protein